MKPPRRRTARTRRCSAELHSAVSPICNRLGAVRLGRLPTPKHLNPARAAECNSAIRPIENLRSESAELPHGSAEFHSAVSPTCSRLGAVRLGRLPTLRQLNLARAAECNSAL